MNTEISRDKQKWFKVKNVPVVLPEEMKDISAEGGQERLLQAQLREDERSKDRRREKLDELQGRRLKTERRQPEGVASKAHRKIKSKVEYKAPPARWNIISGTLVVGLVIGLLVLGGYIFSQNNAAEIQRADCLAAPKPGVNWNHCQMEGRQLIAAMLDNAKLKNTNFSGANLSGAKLMMVDLAYANLSIVSLANADLKKAKLKGVNFRGSNLTNADFSGADLSYADLRGANITDANFTGAILDRAIWVDGRQCKIGSTGVCK